MCGPPPPYLLLLSHLRVHVVCSDNRGRFSTKVMVIFETMVFKPEQK